jgi:Signal transduction histidine kinase
MKIKTKILISNVLMVILPVVFAILIGMVGSEKIDKKYIYPLEHLFEDENAVVSVQSTIYAYQEELWNTNWKVLEKGQVGHQDNNDEDNIKWDELKVSKNELEQTKKMYNLGNELSAMGYHFGVFMDGECQYSNMTEKDSKTIKVLTGDSITHARSLVIGEENSSVIKSTFEEHGIVCEIIAVNSGNKVIAGTSISYLKKYITRFVVLFLFLVIVIILLTNLILSWWITGSILHPLRKLSDGTRRIREGDLETRISYYKKDEFGTVCNDFDKMRGYLKESVEERIRYETSRREMISGISHDLRTPLTSIKGYLEGLMTGIASDNKMRKHYLNAMYVRSQDLERLVNNLSVYNKLENQVIVYHKKSVDLKQVILRYLEENSLDTDKYCIQFNLEFRDEKYPVEVDVSEFRRVFDNLISNSIKYRNKDNSTILISLENKDGNVICTFEDDGPGVPDKALSRLFDSFYRVDDARANAGEGSGLGLSIVKEIIKGQGGTIFAKNGELGLKIVMSLPLEKE